MSFLKAIRLGFRRLRAAPRLLLALWLTNLAVALPAAWAMDSLLRDAIGASLVHESLRAGFDMDWFWTFRTQARGLGTSFKPTLVGAGAFYENLEGWVTGEMFTAFSGIVGLGLLYALLWGFLLGGALERLARPAGALSPAEFAGACGRYFFRFLRLGLIGLVPYLAVYLLSRWGYGRLASLTRDVTRERAVLALSLLFMASTAFLLILVHMVIDYARIATVVEGHRDMLRACLRGLGFVLAHPLRTLGIYYGLALVSAALLLLYALLAPGAGPSSAAGVALAFLAGQLFLLARLAVRLTLLAGQTVLFQTTAGVDGGLGPPPIR
ncbi:MAG: hypothetical protein ACE5JH_04285 [Acidobacteriota bacterium]